MKHTQAIEIPSKDVKDYDDRNIGRSNKLAAATMSMVGYYMALGDDQATAEGKVTQISDEIAPYLRAYEMGNTQLLKNKLQEINSLVFFDQAAKDYLIALL